jgi:hypothetical protein
MLEDRINEFNTVKSEVLKAVNVKITIFWSVTPYSLL